MIKPEKTVNILLVDDHPENLLALEAILKDLGHVLVQATSGTEALRELMSRDFALILLDVKMPGLSGVETAALIHNREQTRHIPIIFLTAIDTSASQVAEGYSVGAVDYLSKPFNPDILRSKVKVFVDLYIKNHQLREQAELLRRMEQAQHDRRLAEVQSQRDRFFSLAVDMLCLAELNGSIREVNPAGLRLLALSEEEIRGKPLATLIHPEDREAFEGHWRKLREGAGVVSFYSRALRREGKELWAACTLISFPREDVCYLVARDITDRVQAELAVKEKTSQIIRHQAALLELSRLEAPELESALRVIAGTSARTLRAESASVWLYREDRSAIECHELYRCRGDLHERGGEIALRDFPTAFEAFESSRFIPSLEADPRTAGLAEAWFKPKGLLSVMVATVRLHGRPVGLVSFEQAGEPREWSSEEQGFACAVADVVSVTVASVQRNCAETKLRELNAELERRVSDRTSQYLDAIKEIEAFAYTVSHDLRAPLRAMHGLSQALLEDYGPRLDAQGRSHALRIVKAAQRLDRLIQDLLSYSRLSRAEIELGPVDTQSLLDQILADLQAEIQERKARVVVHAPLPPVRGHEITLAQVLTNLLSNAVKFVAPDVAPQVEVRAEAENGTVRLWVEDNGIGIEPAHHERIFRVFERLNRAEDYPGTGIGLAIVKKAITRTGGQVGVDSRRTGGSRFWIELPKGDVIP